MSAQNDTEFLEIIIKSLVENPDAVKVSRWVDDMGVFIELVVDPIDMEPLPPHVADLLPSFVCRTRHRRLTARRPLRSFTNARASKVR